MKIYVEEPTRVVIDPHDGTCNGDHNIAVVGIFGDPDDEGERCFTHLTWGLSAVLGLERSREFRDALDVALDIAARMEEFGPIVPREVETILAAHGLKPPEAVITSPLDKPGA